MWADRSKTWRLLSEKERKDEAIKRASAHEKQLKYVDSMKENIICLRKLYENCQEKKITLYFLNFPFFREYIDGIPSKYKEIAPNMSKQIMLCCDKYIDVNTILTFETSNFVDCDHLSNDGAKKMTQLFKEKICKELV